MRRFMNNPRQWIDSLLCLLYPRVFLMSAILHNVLGREPRFSDHLVPGLLYLSPRVEQVPLQKGENAVRVTLLLCISQQISSPRTGPKIRLMRC